MNEWVLQYLESGSGVWMVSAQHPREDYARNAHLIDKTVLRLSLEDGLRLLTHNADEGSPHYRLYNVNTGETIPMEIFS